MSVNPGTEARWWLPEYKPERSRYVLNVVDRIWEAQAWRRDLHQRHARLYGNIPISGLGPRAFTRQPMRGSSSTLAYNVCKAVSDTYVAMLTTDRPKVTFQLEGGTWKEQQQSEAAERFVDGVFYETKTFGLAPMLALGSAVFGQAHVEPYVTKDRKIAHDPVNPWEVVIDDDEAYGSPPDPPNSYRRMVFDIGRLCALFPDKKDAIMAAKRVDPESGDLSFELTSNRILVTKAWHQPSGPGEEDGLHVIAIDTRDGQGVLLEEPRDMMMSPLVPLRRPNLLAGWWSTGIVQELTGIQLEINVLLQKIQRSHHLLAAGHWLIDNASKINSNKIDNDIGSIIRYTGRPPTLETGMSVQAEVYQHLDRLYQKAFELPGVPLMQAQGQIPKGLEASGRAMRVYSDINSQRFKPAYAAYQAFFLELARYDIALANKIDGYRVRTSTRRGMVTVDWKRDVKIDEENAIVRLYPTNALAQDPAAKEAQVQDWVNAGWIDKGDAMRMLDFPDLQAFESYENASYDLVQSIISGILDDDVYVGPEEFMNLSDSVRRVQLSYLKGKREGRPEARLRNLIRWIQQAQEIPGWPGFKPPTPAPNMLAPPSQQANAPPPMPGPPAGAPPMPPGPPAGEPLQ